jgi:hypothetical protein
MQIIYRVEFIEKKSLFLCEIIETFTRYDGPSTTPDTGRSLDETITMKYEFRFIRRSCI